VLSRTVLAKSADQQMGIVGLSHIVWQLLRPQPLVAFFIVIGELDLLPSPALALTTQPLIDIE